MVPRFTALDYRGLHCSYFSLIVCRSCSEAYRRSDRHGIEWGLLAENSAVYRKASSRRSLNRAARCHDRGRGGLNSTDNQRDNGHREGFCAENSPPQKGVVFHYTLMPKVAFHDLRIE